MLFASRDESVRRLRNRVSPNRLLCTQVKNFDDVDVQIGWWASKEKLASLVAGYEKASGVRPRRNSLNNGWTFETAKLTLQVMPAAQAAKTEPCLGTMAANELSIVLIARQTPARKKP